MRKVKNVRVPQPVVGCFGLTVQFVPPSLQYRIDAVCPRASVQVWSGVADELVRSARVPAPNVDRRAAAFGKSYSAPCNVHVAPQLDVSFRIWIVQRIHGEQRLDEVVERALVVASIVATKVDGPRRRPKPEPVEMELVVLAAPDNCKHSQ